MVELNRLGEFPHLDASKQPLGLVALLMLVRRRYQLMRRKRKKKEAFAERHLMTHMQSHRCNLVH